MKAPFPVRVRRRHSRNDPRLPTQGQPPSNQSQCSPLLQSATSGVSWPPEQLHPGLLHVLATPFHILEHHPDFRRHLSRASWID